MSRRGGTGRRRLYDFRDLVSLRVAADLRKQGISLQVIRKVVEHLRDLDYEHPLAELRFWADAGHLYFREAGTVREGRHPSQTVAEFVVPIAAIVEELEQGILEFDSARPVGKLERRRGVLGSKPVIAGTRIPVATIKRLRADGVTEAEILEMYPDISRADIRAAAAWKEPSRRARAAG